MKLDRYSRQMILPEIGKAGQDKLARASVLCIGAGGLGSPALLYLAAVGIGRLGIVDFDRVDETNLQRQILYTSDDMGQSKTCRARERLRAFNSSIHIESYDEELTTENVPRLFQNYDIILDGTDNFATKFLINDAAIKYRKTLIYGAIQGFDGQVAVFDGQDGPCYRCLYPEPPRAEVSNCAEAGVVGAIAGLVGITQALQAIQLIVGDKSFAPLTGKLWLIDGKTMHSRILNIPKKKDCSICSQPREKIILKDISVACEIVPRITAQDYSTLCEDHVLIDVREVQEWDASHYNRALHWPLSKLKEGKLPPIPLDKKVIVYCQKGKRSVEAGEILQLYGYTDISSVIGGYDVLKRDA